MFMIVDYVRRKHVIVNGMFFLDNVNVQIKNDEIENKTLYTC